MQKLIVRQTSSRISPKLLPNWFSTAVNTAKQKNSPDSADVVIIGGGSAGCHTFYHLAKQNINAVLVERSKITSGTTWHTSGLLWRLRPSDVDIQLLASSRQMLIDIAENTEFNSGWTECGGLFIARKKERVSEYMRLHVIGQGFGIESSVVTASEAQKIFPLLNANAFTAALYSPGDGSIDPTLLCNALTKLATRINPKSHMLEHSGVKVILTEINQRGQHKVIGVELENGSVIKTECVVNATGVWGRDLIERFGISLPIIPMKHSYIVSEPIDGIFGMPNVRDHDASIYFRIQGSSIQMGGYECNPILIDRVRNSFSFDLYDFDWATYEEHVKGAEQLCPAFGAAGIRATICGPEAFTPDHKPIMGPDPRLIGLFHNCGFNSAGLMFGGGCGAQLAHWIAHGRPALDMRKYDIRRFIPQQLSNTKWITERSHEAYATNYSMVFENDQPLAGRNLIQGPLHKRLGDEGAFMQHMYGHEIPAFFYRSMTPITIPPYEWYGAYGHKPSNDKTYHHLLGGDLKYDFSDHHETIGREAMHCRTKVAVFDHSHFGKVYISGIDAEAAMNWLCTADIEMPNNTIIQSCALNSFGGIEATFSVTLLDASDIQQIGAAKIFKSKAYYVVFDGSITHQLLAHLQETCAEKSFNVKFDDVTQRIGIISLQGPNSRKIIEELTGLNLKNGSILPAHTSLIIPFNCTNSSTFRVRLQRTSLIGELGYELHVENEYCTEVYNHLMNVGLKYQLHNAGHRAFYSLACEKGTHLRIGLPLLGYDLRSDDTPIEANLEHLCRKNGDYKGSEVVKKQQTNGVDKRLTYFTIDEKVPLWGLEVVYRNGETVGFVRRADYGHFIDKPIGKAYVGRSGGGLVDENYLNDGRYELNVGGVKHVAKLHLRSPFDVDDQRINGFYV